MGNMSTARNLPRRCTKVNMAAVDQDTDVKVVTHDKSFVVDWVKESALINDFLDLEFVGGEKQMMGAANDLKEMTEYPLILVEGGDDRLPLDPKSGTNKYHQKPYVATDALIRGSCTCNSPTPVAYETAKIYH